MVVLGRVLTAAASGLALSLAFPKWDLWWLGWLGLAPFFWLYSKPNVARPGLTGWVFGLAFAGSTFYFIGIFGYLPVVALVLQQSLFYWVLGLLLATAARGGPWARGFGFAGLWTAFEWLRSLGPLGHTIGALGYSQFVPLVPLQAAALVGVFGVSFVVATFNACLAVALGARGGAKGRPATPCVAATIALVAGLLGFGWWRLATAEREPMGAGYAVGVVQTEVRLGPPGTCGIAARDDFDRYLRATYAMGRGKDLIVWPETAVDGSVLRSPMTRRLIMRAARAVSSYLLVGCTEEDGGRRYNTALLFGPHGEVVGRYDKRRPILFGEYVPWRKQLRPLLERYPIPTRDYTPGREPPVMRAGRATLGIMICFEALFPSAGREARNRGANLLVVTTNDGWFGLTAGVYDPLVASAVRAIENNAPLVRAAKSGISCYIDSRGRVHQATGLYQAGTVEARVPLAGKLTLYDRIGDLVPMLCGLWALWVAASGIVAARRPRAVRVDVG